MRRQEKIDKIIMDIYHKLYAAATPAADFDLLMEESPKNERGQVMIPYLDYEIEQSLCDSIIEEALKNFKAPKRIKESIKISIYMRCSPKFKRDPQSQKQLQ